MRFSELHLEPTLISAIDKLNFQECTPIQDATFIPAVEGRDVAGLAQTGTGKTAAFLVPLMDRILKARVQTEGLAEEQQKLIGARAFKDWKAQNFILILVPTRELAEQVHENAKKLSVDSGLRSAAVIGGTAYDKQKEAFQMGFEFVVATPGRLIDLYKEHIVDLKQVRAVIFDEADRMFDMGFKDDMKFILSRIPRERQMLVFSATLNFDVTNTIYQFGADPVEVNVSRDQTKAENVKDEIFHCGHDEKGVFLMSLLKKYNPSQAIIFCNYKHSVEKIAQYLSQNGVPAVGISSLLSQSQRNRVMEQFRAVNEKNILVATDVAARGLDIKGVDVVINFDLPQDAESYVHRIGRTGRAGQEGRAFSMVSDRDVESLGRVEEYLKHKLPIGWMETSEMLKDVRPLYLGSVRSFDDRGGPRREGRSGGGFRPDSRGGGGRSGPPRGDREGGRDGGRRDSRRGSGSPRPDHQRAGSGGGDRQPRAAGGGSGRPPHRQENSSHSNPSASGTAGEPRSTEFRQDSRRPLHGERRPPRHGGQGQGPRPSGQQANGQHPAGPGSSGGGGRHQGPRRRHGQGQSQGSHRQNENPRQGSHPAKHASPRPAAAKPAGAISKKVTGFLKRLLGAGK